MNKDQQDKLRQAIYEKLVEKEAAEKKAAAPLVEETESKELKPRTKMDLYTERLQAQVRKNPLTESANLLGGEEEKPVTQTDLRQLKASLASLGGGGVGAAEIQSLVGDEFVNQDGDSMTGDLWSPGLHITRNDSDRTILYYETLDSTHTLEALDGEATDFDNDWIVTNSGGSRFSALFVDDHNQDSVTYYASGYYNDGYKSTNGYDWHEWEVPIGGVMAVNDNASTFVIVKQNGISKLNWSTDSGQTWSSKNDGTTGLSQYLNWSSIAYGNGKFVATAYGVSSSFRNVKTSSDGITWSEPASVGDSNNYSSVTWSEENGRFVITKALANNGLSSILWSEDGDNWNFSEPVSDSDGVLTFNDAAYGEGVWVAVGHNGNIAYSANNGEEWFKTNFLEDNDIGPIEQQLFTFTSVAYANGYFIAVGGTSGYEFEGKRGAYSTDGINWKKMVIRGRISLDEIVAAGDTFVAKGSGTNSDGANRYGLATLEIMEETKGSLLFDGKLVATKDNLALAVEKLNDISFELVPLEERPDESIDFDAWIAHSSADDTLGWSSLAYGAGKFVSVAGGYYDEGTKKKVMYSTDGVNWTSVSSSRDTNKWNDVTYADGKFVAVCDNGSNKVMYSSDGITWTGVVSAYEGSTWKGVAYGDDKFVAVAGNQDHTKKVMYSSDATSWTLATIPASETSIQMTSVTHGDGVWVAVGNGGTFESQRAIYSTDGITWSAASGLPSQRNWQAVAYADGKFVTVGSVGVIAYSTDGITWTTDGIERNWVKNIDFYNIVYQNNTWLALGSGGGAYSEDGLVWKLLKTPDDSKRWIDVVHADNKYVAIAGGFSNYPSPVAILETPEFSKGGLYWNDQLIATEANLEPVFDKVNELANAPSVIYQDSDPFLQDSVWAAATYKNGQLWFNSSTPAGSMSIRHNDSWVAI